MEKHVFAVLLAVVAPVMGETPGFTLENTGRTSARIWFSGGQLERTENLVDWEEVDSSSPFDLTVTRPREMFRVKAYAEEDLVPVIAFTGQSNCVHMQRNYSPYSTREMPYQTIISVGGAQPGVPVMHQSLRETVQAKHSIGALWEFAQLLEVSDFRRSKARRFAFAQTGGGGRAAREWSGWLTRVRGIEFKTAVDAIIASLNEEPNTAGYLHAVVINQGEREAATGLDWALSWTNFFGAVRSRYGPQVQIYVQTLNGLNLMPRQATQEPQWTQTRNLQLSVATGSGSAYARSATWVFDTNALGGVENRSRYCRDSDVHYSNAAMSLLAAGTFEQFREANGLEE